MKFINEFKNNDRVIEHFLCAQKQLMKTKTGKNYFSLTLQDKTATINAKVWDINYNIQEFEQGDFIKIDALVQVFNDELQLNVSKLRKSEIGEYDLKNYVPATSKNVDSLKNELQKFISSVKNNFLSALLKSFFDDEEMLEKFCTHSAGKSMHHSYVGGLLEHTISVTQICDFMSARTKLSNRDILITVGLLHDIGKIYELSDFPQNDYTYDGELLGHIIIGSDLISKKILQIENFPNDLRSQIIHCILSHHGEYEFGSPKLPRSIEAIILHFADNLDAKTKMFEEIVEADSSNSDWTNYNKLFARRLLKPNV